MHLFSNSFCRAVENTFVGKGIQGSTWLFPAIETIHMVTMIFFVGCIAVSDLRLLGLLLRGQSVSQLVRRLLPWTWTAFGVMVVTGTLLYTSDSVTKYCHNLVFYTKLLLILLSGVNVLVYRYTVYRRVGEWDEAPDTPLGAKLAGGFSLLLWIGVVVMGRWIAFY